MHIYHVTQLLHAGYFLLPLITKMLTSPADLQEYTNICRTPIQSCLDGGVWDKAGQPLARIKPSTPQQLLVKSKAHVYDLIAVDARAQNGIEVTSFHI